MSHLTTHQATQLVDNGNCLLRLKDEVYEFHKFSGNLDGDYYECETPNQVDLELTKDSTLVECKTAFISWFVNHQDYKGIAPTIVDSNIW
tara:strand:+ start:640 stop:909 length:270 start_codon:yes stop_codon:yes gene_type:complete